LSVFSSDIEKVFEDGVFSDSSLKITFSPCLVKYLVQEDSEVEVSPLTHQRKINFFSLLVKRQESREGLNTRRFDFLITILYCIEKDAKNLSYQKIRDGLETVQDLVITNIDSQITNLVDFYEIQPIADFIFKRVADVPCWEGSLKYSAVKSIFI
jgi:hypothetical protein